MDGSTATSFTERTRQQISRAFVNKSANEANAQSQLFEQLLKLSFTVQPPPEKQPDPPDSTVAKSSSTEGDKKDTAKVDEEKESEPSVAVANLTQAASLVAEKLPELTQEQPVVVPNSDDGQSKSTELDASKVTEPAATSSESNSASQLSSQVDQKVVVVDTQEIEPIVDSATTVSDTSLATPSTESADSTDDSSSKKVAPGANKAGETNAKQPHELANTDKKDSSESTATKALHETTAKTEPASEQRDDRDDRRSDRREKWFEHKNEAIANHASDRPTDIDSSKPIQENADPVKTQSADASLQPLTLAVPTSDAQSVDSTIAPSVNLPVAVSLVQQISSPSTPTLKETSASIPEASSSVSSAPSRTVGSQSDKPKSKEKVTEPGLSQQERVRVIQRIARSFNRISTEGGSINLRLHPENLGSVSVQVRLEGKSLSARLSTETTAARDAIMQDLPALRQRLADQGFDVTKFQVDVAGNGADASFAQSGGQSQSGQSENRSSGGQTDYRRVAAIRESRAATTRQLIPNTGLNWQVNTGIDLQA